MNDNEGIASRTRGHDPRELSHEPDTAAGDAAAGIQTSARQLKAHIAKQKKESAARSLARQREAAARRRGGRRPGTGRGAAGKKRPPKGRRPDDQLWTTDARGRTFGGGSPLDDEDDRDDYDHDYDHNYDRDYDHNYERDYDHNYDHDYDHGHGDEYGYEDNVDADDDYADYPEQYGYTADALGGRARGDGRSRTDSRQSAGAGQKYSAPGKAPPTRGRGSAHSQRLQKERRSSGRGGGCHGGHGDGDGPDGWGTQQRKQRTRRSRWLASGASGSDPALLGNRLDLAAALAAHQADTTAAVQLAMMSDDDKNQARLVMALKRLITMNPNKTGVSETFKMCLANAFDPKLRYQGSNQYDRYAVEALRDYINGLPDTESRLLFAVVALPGGATGTYLRPVSDPTFGAIFSVYRWEVLRKAAVEIVLAHEKKTRGDVNPEVVREYLTQSLQQLSLGSAPSGLYKKK